MRAKFLRCLFLLPAEKHGYRTVIFRVEQEAVIKKIYEIDWNDFAAALVKLFLGVPRRDPSFVCTFDPCDQFFMISAVHVFNARNHPKIGIEDTVTADKC